jgi:hypothetical protein
VVVVVVVVVVEAAAYAELDVVVVVVEVVRVVVVVVVDWVRLGGWGFFEGVPFVCFSFFVSFFLFFVIVLCGKSWIL